MEKIIANNFKKLLLCLWLAFPSPSYLATVALRGEEEMMLGARVLGVFVNLDRGFVGGKDQILVIFSTF